MLPALVGRTVLLETNKNKIKHKLKLNHFALFAIIKKLDPQIDGRMYGRNLQQCCFANIIVAAAAVVNVLRCVVVVVGDFDVVMKVMLWFIIFIPFFFCFFFLLDFNNSPELSV